MPSLGPSLLFATGLALGIGAGVLVPRKSEQVAPIPPVYTPPPPPSGEKREVGKLATPSGGVTLAGGFPGTYYISSHCRDVRLYADAAGPIPDIIKREAYTAAYDRRMRHPAWVCL
jgi:endonuclease G